MIPKKVDAARRAQALAAGAGLLDGGRTLARAALARDAERGKRTKTLHLPSGAVVNIIEPESEEEVERDREALRDLLVRDDLVRLGFSAMRVSNRYRFGWRLWTLDSAGRIRSPMFDTGRAVDHPSIVADCPHGHEVPSAACRCGIYFVPHWFPFHRAVDDLLDGDFTAHALTWGVAIGGVDVDPGGDQWGIRPRRTGRFRILGGMVPEEAPQPALPVPWRRGFTDRNAFAVEKLWDLGAPSNFHDVVAKYQDEPATSFNADDVEDPEVTAWQILRRLDHQ
ncbi:hypothetical protein GP2_013_00020 [Gordonia paraffinivorans NBRC 108238]|uniref:Uncharacterized protein n=1 Tax=Gordonia paraffinivorans NBRC 108238 TaxID=1223543 RepID=A0ABQ0IKP4_9ACTN|nr:hypothetical protein [Gordonia paraffinivorans]GAC83526.1 hypothetical protein GP2_013_00020 [Gordonia paraffinivorans NBRC 108238]